METNFTSAQLRIKKNWKIHKSPCIFKNAPIDDHGAIIKIKKLPN